MSGLAGISLNLGDEEQFIHSDGKWLGFVIDQIVTNSLKYTDEGGGISFIFAENNKEKYPQIQDTGIWIKPEDIKRVFEKGFTGLHAKKPFQVYRNGALPSKQMALKLGYHITIHSEEGKYTKVTIHFPRISDYYQL